MCGRNHVISVFIEARTRIRKSKGKHDASGSDLGDESTWSKINCFKTNFALNFLNFCWYVLF